VGTRTWSDFQEYIERYRRKSWASKDRYVLAHIKRGQTQAGLSYCPDSLLLRRINRRRALDTLDLIAETLNHTDCSHQSRARPHDVSCSEGPRSACALVATCDEWYGGDYRIRLNRPKHNSDTKRMLAYNAV
jgi:hypothetical protein